MRASHLIGLSALLTSLMFGLSPVAALADASSTATSSPAATLPAANPSAPIPSELTSCFDYYKFGSVQISFAGNLKALSQGATMTFSGTVQNQNQYPIVGATVYVKIFHLLPQDASKNVNAPDVVDSFAAVPNITLKAGETQPISFTWQAPQDAEPGSYEIATYVAQDNRFELLGLSFTDDVVGPVYDFSLVGQSIGSVSFDKNAVTVNGTPYHFASFAPLMPQGIQQVPIVASVTNTTSAPVDTSVDWKLYSWDGLRPEALITEQTENLHIAANASTTASFTVSDTAHSVYYLVGTIQTPGGSKSIIAVRYVRTDVFEPRFNDVGAFAYPLAQGSLAFACFHSSGFDTAQNVQVDVSVIAPGLFGDSIIGQNSYQGIAPGSLVAITAPVSKPASSFTVVAKLYQSGKLLDTVTIPYDCHVLGGACPNPLIPIASGAAIVLLILVIVIFFIVRARRHHSDATIYTPVPPPPAPPAPPQP